MWAWILPGGASPLLHSCPARSSLLGLFSLVPWENASPNWCLLHFSFHFLKIILFLLFFIIKVLHVSFSTLSRKDRVCLIHMMA